MNRSFWLMLVAGLGVFPLSLLAGSSASITIGGVVYPEFKTTVLTQPQDASLLENRETSVAVAVIQCQRTVTHRIIVESGSAREVLQGTNVGETTVYTVNCRSDAQTIRVTVVSE